MRRWVWIVSVAVGCASAPKEEAVSAPTESSTSGEPSSGEPEKESKLGSLPKEAIRSVVRANMRDVQGCYDAELQLSPGLAGKVVVKFQISKDGLVESAEVTESSLDNRAVERCIVKDVRGWEFPEPENDGIVIVNYPFNFKAP